MAEPYLRQHALAHRALDASPRAVTPDPGDDATGPPVRLALAGPAVQLCLRGDGSAGFRAAVEQVLGVAPGIEANRVTAGGETRVLWLGPDEWLLVRPGEDARDLASALDSALAGRHALVSDVSHSRIILTLAGRRAREVLMKGCGLDLDPRSFAPGHCAQSALARAHMLLHQVSDAPGYHVYIHRSFADYVWTWLEDAAAEYLG